MNEKERINFFGALIDPLTMNETLNKVSEIIETKTITQHVVVNVAKLVFMQKDENLKNIVNSCDLINADGAGIVFGAKLLGVNIPERVAGIDLMENIVKMSSEKGYSIYFLGAQEEIITKVISKYKAIYPNLKVAGYRNGYYTEQEELTIAENIRDSKADVLFVAISSPKKEIFLNKYLNIMNVPFVMGVGGSFDVVAGKVSRSPVFMQKLGLEWFYRLIQEPRRMWKRYLVTNSIFLYILMKSFVNRWHYNFINNSFNPFKRLHNNAG
ncbi:MAG: WecB/TagA/CpsF family glycosyltransferase [Vampirovibrionia bacterium]